MNGIIYQYDGVAILQTTTRGGSDAYIIRIFFFLFIKFNGVYYLDQ